MVGSGDATEDGGEPIPLSALQHYVVCPRQVALIHTERQWAENLETAHGRIEHKRVDRPGTRSRDGVRRATGVTVHSAALGVIGRADVVEFHLGADGSEGVFPVEHKRGRPKRHDGDKVQLCAQALCLEEMLGVEVPAGALFYGEQRRRLDVAFDAGLRTRTRQIAADTRALLASGVTPPAVPCPACPKCSLRGRCRPDELGADAKSVAAYVRRRLRAGAAEAGGELR